MIESDSKNAYLSKAPLLVIMVSLSVGVAIGFISFVLISISGISNSVAQSITQNNQDYVDVNQAIIEGKNVSNSITSYNGWLQLYEIKYNITSFHKDFILPFLPNANPVQTKPTFNCVANTRNIFEIIGYQCDFGTLKNGDTLDIIFHNAKLFGIF